MLFTEANANPVLTSCPSSDIMDQTQLHRPMLADNMVRTESSNILSPMLSKNNIPLMSKQGPKQHHDEKANLIHQYQQNQPLNEALPTSPRTFSFPSVKRGINLNNPPMPKKQKERFLQANH